MRQLFAQGDLLIERVEDACGTGGVEQSIQESLVLAEGEATGHRHVLHDQVTMFRDDGLARDIPVGLYVGHVRVLSPCARLEHDEHATLTLPRGTYRVRRQRELEPKDVQIVSD
jgi:hypothetical protein